MSRRRLHAGAWWVWAGALAVAAALTTNPLLLALIVAVASLVVARRRPPEPWATGFGLYLGVAAAVLAVRVAFRLVFAGPFGTTVVFSVPSLDLGGIRLGGPVTAENLVAGLNDGLRLAALVVCVGAANTLADPRRLLRSLPRSLAGVATAVALAVALAPQLTESIRRVGLARRLRGDTSRGLRRLRALLVPVLEDTLARSLAMAASMASRGYGRLGSAAPAWARLSLVVGLASLLAGSFAVLSGHGLGPPLAVAGIGGLAAGVAGAGSVPSPSRYRPEEWAGREWVVAGAGLAAATAVAAVAWLSPGLAHPPIDPLAWPPLPPVPAAAILLAALPAADLPRRRLAFSPVRA